MRNELKAEPLQIWCASLDSTLAWGYDIEKGRARFYSTQAQEASPPPPKPLLTVGCGSLGMHDCTNTFGKTLNWQAFINKDEGILATMRELELDVVALPGARLSPDFRASDKWNVHIFCRGTPALTAVHYSGAKSSIR